MIKTLEEARELYKDETMLALDLETTGLSPWNTKIAVIALFGPKSGEIAILHYPRGVSVPQDVLDWLSTFDEIITHNGTQFDILFLANAGMDWKPVKWYDTMIGEQSVISVNRRDVRVNLQDSIKRRLGKKIDKNIDHGSWGNETLDENQMMYLTGDISYLYQLRVAQESKADLDPSGDMRRGLEFEMDLIPGVVEMILRGIPIDVNALESYVDASMTAKEEIEPALVAALGPVKLSSPIALRRVLDEMFPGMFPDTTAARFGEYKNLPGPIGDISTNMLAWRHADQRRKMFSQKWMNDYIVYHPDGARVHGKFWQVGTETGRFSSSNPNLQQLPRDSKAIFGNMPGMAFGKSDFAAIEVRVAAALAHDEAMIEAFNAGEDIHTLVASASFNLPPEEISSEQRRIAKAISFTFLFGGGLETFLAYSATNGSSISRDMGRIAMERFFNRFTGIKNMRDRAEFRCATGHPLPIVYPTGLKRMLIGDDLRASVLLNNVVQGTAAAGLKMALRLMIQNGVIKYVCAVVHDEVAYWAPYDEIEEVRTTIDDCMIAGMHEALQDCDPIRIGVESTWGTNWKGSDDHVRLTERDRE